MEGHPDETKPCPRLWLFEQHLLCSCQLHKLFVVLEQSQHYNSQPPINDIIGTCVPQ